MEEKEIILETEGSEEQEINLEEEIASYIKNIKIVNKLPEPSETYRGTFKILDNGQKDTLYICLKINQYYEWVNVSSGSGAVDEVDTTSILGKAILGTMVLQ